MKKESAKKQEQDMTLEEAFAELEQTVQRLESSESTLEDSFHSYEEGMKLLKYCNDCIDRVEKKVMVIDESGSLHEF